MYDYRKESELDLFLKLFGDLKVKSYLIVYVGLVIPLNKARLVINWM